MYKLQRDITPQFARESICLERKCREIVESKLEDGQCDFRPGRSTTDQIFTLKQIFEKSWKYGKDLFACFVDLEKVCDRIPRDKLWKVLREYGVNGQLLRAIKSFYCRPEVCVRVNGKQSKPFHMGVGLRQGCVLSPLLFIVYMNWIDKCSQADECVTIGNCKISRLLFADDLVMLSSTESGLQRALNSFADVCNTAGMKISTAKTEVLHLSRNPGQCVLQVNGATLKHVEKFKYLGVTFTSDGRQDKKLDTRIGKAIAVMRALHYSVVMKRELSKKAKLSIFKAVFVPTLTYGHESWVMIKRMRSQVQASEMRFLQRIEGVTMFNKVRSSEIRKSFNIEPLLLRIERSQLRWFGHVSRMPQERLPKQALRAKANGRRPVGRFRTRWTDYIEDLGWNRLGLRPSEMMDMMEDREVWGLNLELLPPQPSRKSGQRRRNFFEVVLLQKALFKHLRLKKIKKKFFLTVLTHPNKHGNHFNQIFSKNLLWLKFSVFRHQIFKRKRFLQNLYVSTYRMLQNFLEVGYKNVTFFY